MNVATLSGPRPPPKTVFCHNLIDFNRTFPLQKTILPFNKFPPTKEIPVHLRNHIQRNMVEAPTTSCIVAQNITLLVAICQQFCVPSTNPSGDMGGLSALWHLLATLWGWEIYLPKSTCQWAFLLKSTKRRKVGTNTFLCANFHDQETLNSAVSYRLGGL